MGKFFNGLVLKRVCAWSAHAQTTISSDLYNDLSRDLSANAQLFADGTSLFSTVRDINISATHLKNDLRKISNWAFQWKINFNSDPSKQTQEII